MSIATMGSRFQVVIPAKERKNIGLRQHQKVRVESKDGCIVISPIGGKTNRGILEELRSDEDPLEFVRKIRSEWSDR